MLKQHNLFHSPRFAFTFKITSLEPIFRVNVNVKEVRYYVTEVFICCKQGLDHSFQKLYENGRNWNKKVLLWQKRHPTHIDQPIWLWLAARGGGWYPVHYGKGYPIPHSSLLSLWKYTVPLWQGIPHPSLFPPLPWEITRDQRLGYHCPFPPLPRKGPCRDQRLG